MQNKIKTDQNEEVEVYEPSEDDKLMKRPKNKEQDDFDA